MLQGRLNTLHVHKQRTDSLDLKELANDFIPGCEHRVCIFLLIDLYGTLLFSRLVYYKHLTTVCVVRWVWSVVEFLAYQCISGGSVPELG